MNYQDISYLSALLDMWSIAEVTCGILATCLPISPKFFRSLQDAKLWSNLRISLHSFTGSKKESTSKSETSSDRKIPAKLNSSSNSLKACFKKYRYVTTNESELVSVSSNGGVERTVSDDGENETA